MDVQGKIHGVNLFSKHAYGSKDNGDGTKGKSLISIERLDSIIFGFTDDSQWVLDYEKMRRRRVGE